MEDKREMMDITTSNSIKVNPFFLYGIVNPIISL